jgi:aminoglycoside phosphotransferase family enzyme/predicted kinase
VLSEAEQKAVVELLSRPEFYGDGRRVEHITTHISHVFLVGERVFKLKRAVKLPYVDFSSLEARKKACDDELRLNRRTAPDIYLEVKPIELDGKPADYVVVMRRFPQDQVLDELAGKPGGLTREMMETLAEALVAFHAKAEVHRDKGGFAATAAIARGNIEILNKFIGQLDAAKIETLGERTETALAATHALLDKRRDAGMVRHCHGDLHLNNIVLLGGKPTPFDCIEFNEDFAVIDVLYDLAFLLMDLEHRGLEGLANAVLNRTFDMEGDAEGLACLPLFLSMRAAVRAHVDATQQKFAEAAQYLDLALQFLEPAKPRLLAVGGLSGSGKSSVARLVAPGIGRAPGALVMRSDAARKRLAGVSLYDKLPQDAYTPEMSGKVYGQLIADARRALQAGQSVILDAVHAKSEERAAGKALAAELGVPFDGFWLDVPLDVRTQRIGGRTRDASDATAAVTKAQEDYELGAMDWHVLDGRKDLKSLMDDVSQVTGRGSLSGAE